MAAFPLSLTIYVTKDETKSVSSEVLSTGLLLKDQVTLASINPQEPRNDTEKPTLHRVRYNYSTPGAGL